MDLNWNRTEIKQPWNVLRV